MTEWSGENFLKRRGKWSKQDRKTFTSQVIDRQKKLLIPAPGQWDGCNKSLMSCKNAKEKCDKTERNLKNIADAIQIGISSPGPVAKKAEFDPRFKLVEHKDPQPKIQPLSKPNPFGHLVERKGPGPQTYKLV